ncbi:MAG: hypothetical protein ACO1OO_17490 [Flavisolibacter sp.]
MKKLVYILFFTLFFQAGAMAQQPNGVGKVREKMVEYIQDRLNLSRAEAEKFQPIFLNYFNDLRKTNQQYRNDRLVLQQKVIELRLRYRDQLKPVIGEKRSNEVFQYERDFVDKVKEIRDERMDNRRGGRANKKGINF